MERPSTTGFSIYGNHQILKWGRWTAKKQRMMGPQMHPEELDVWKKLTTDPLYVISDCTLFV
jgi:hypothetical protein